MNTRNQNGFTIVETLVAIAILMIAIAGPLTAANKAYTAAINARNQAVAYNLAQEALEYISNQKDNSLATAGGQFPTTWNTCFTDGFCTSNAETNLFGIIPRLSSTSTTTQYIADVNVSWTTPSGDRDSVDLQELITNGIR